MNNLDLIRNYINNEQYSDAIDLIADIESQYLNSDEYWNLRGITCLHLEAYALCEDSFLKALELNPSNPDTNYNLATLYQILDCSSDAALYYGLCYRYTKDNELKLELEALFNNGNPCKPIFDCARSTSKKSYIILSNIPWSDIQQRVHHISKALASFGNNVYFIDPKKDITIEEHPDIKNLALACSLEPTYQHNTLKVFKPLIVRNSDTGEIQYDTYLDLLNHLSANIINLNEDINIIAYHPDFIDILNNYKTPHTLIYDCVDDHSDNEIAYWGGKDCILKEQELMNKADFITTTATSLFVERAILQDRKNVFLSKNAVSEIDFTILDEEELIDLDSIPHPRIVYSGFVYKRFDEKLFYEIVKSNPDKSFIVIGPISEGLLQEQYPNLYFLGTKKHSELKHYLSKCDIGIVPHIEQCDMDIACDSIKQYEFLASGLDVITTFVPESVLDKTNIYTASTVDEFNSHISTILKDRDSRELSHIKPFLSANSWNNRAALICNLTDSKMTNSDFEQLLDYTKHTLSACAKAHSNPIIQTLNIMAMDCSSSEKLDLMKNIYSISNERFVERYYLKLLLELKHYNTAIDIINSSIWVDKEISDELKTLSVNEINSISTLIALASNDFVLAKSLCKKIKHTGFSSLYDAYINLKLGFVIPNEILTSLEKLKINTPIFKYLTQYINDIATQNSNTFIIGDNTALSRTMLIKVEKSFPLSNYISFEELNSTKKDELFSKLSQPGVNIIVLSEAHYVNIIRLLAKNNIKECSIALIIKDEVELSHVSESIMNAVKNETYKSTVALIHVDSRDTNIHAIVKLMPDEYKDKYSPLLIHLDNLRDKKFSVLIPLVASITVSGHGSVYHYLSNYTHHIEVWHAGLSLKTCGLMDKKLKTSGIGGSLSLFQRVNTFCVASYMDMMIKNSWFALSEDRYNILGQPRTDYLFLANGRKNLEKVLKTNLKDKKIILNMPTFHTFDFTGRVEGAADLNESIKIRNFDYIKFNNYLIQNNMVCITKVHPREADIVNQQMQKYKGSLSNIFLLTNEDLDVCNVSIYEILNGADILITDYSSIYSDFLLLDRPIIFINTDIDDYRTNRGLSLEPYDFWTAGPKVQSQDKLHEELLLCANNQNYYKEQRDLLMPLFHKYTDNQATRRFWELIDEITQLN